MENPRAKKPNFKLKFGFKKTVVNVFAIIGFISVYLSFFSGAIISPNEKYLNLSSINTKIKLIEDCNSITKKIDSLSKINYNNYIEYNTVFDFEYMYMMELRYYNNIIALEREDFQEIDMPLSNSDDATYTNAPDLPIIQPISNFDLVGISSLFGMRLHPIYKTPMFHTGVDLSAKRRSNVYASANGVVDKIIYSKHGYGNKIIIKHKNGYVTLYAHLSKLKVKIGEHVKQGQLIGLVGDSGLTTGNHLHYEIYHNDIPNNPLKYFQTYLTLNNY